MKKLLSSIFSSITMITILLLSLLISIYFLICGSGELRSTISLIIIFIILILNEVHLYYKYK